MSTFEQHCAVYEASGVKQENCSEEFRGLCQTIESSQGMKLLFMRKCLDTFDHEIDNA